MPSSMSSFTIFAQSTWLMFQKLPYDIAWQTVHIPPLPTPIQAHLWTPPHRVLMCDVIKFSILHFSIFRTSLLYLPHSTVNFKQRITISRLQSLPIYLFYRVEVFCELRVASWELRVRVASASCEYELRVRVASCELRVEMCKLRVSVCEFNSTHTLRVEQCELRVSHICEFNDFGFQCDLSVCVCVWGEHWMFNFAFAFTESMFLKHAYGHLSTKVNLHTCNYHRSQSCIILWSNIRQSAFSSTSYLIGFQPNLVTSMYEWMARKTLHSL